MAPLDGLFVTVSWYHPTVAGHLVTVFRGEFFAPRQICRKFATTQICHDSDLPPDLANHSKTEKILKRRKSGRSVKERDAKMLRYQNGKNMIVVFNILSNLFNALIFK